MTRNFLDDPKIPHLRQFLDPDAVQQVFAEQLQRDYPEHQFTLEQCRLTKIDYRPASRLRLLFRLRLRDGAGNQHENWFFGKVYPAETAQAKFEQARNKKFPDMNTIWKPVALLPALRTVIWAFPFDAKLPHLREVLDTNHTVPIMREQAAALGVSPQLEAHQVRQQLVKYKPGGRCVLRFEVAGENGRFPPTTFFSKTYKGPNSAYVYKMLQDVTNPAAGLSQHLEIPQPLHHIDHLHTYWQASWEGTTLSEAYRSQAWQAVVPQVATVLAAFHKSNLPQLKQVNYVERAIEEAAEDAIWLKEFLPDDSDKIDELVGRIIALGHQINQTHDIPTVPVHGAFRLSQLLSRDDRLALIDFDTAALGDPLYDVAELMTSLLFQYFRRRLRFGTLRQKADQFSTLYAEQVPWAVDEQRLNWYIAAFLFEKLFGGMKSLLQPLMPKVDDYFALIEHFLHKAHNITPQPAAQATIPA